MDGLKSNLSVWGGECAISENRMRTATWWVNLTRIFSIHHITIYYRTGNQKWGKLIHYRGTTLNYFRIYIKHSSIDIIRLKYPILKARNGLSSNLGGA